MKVNITIGGKKFPSRKEKEQECLEALQHDEVTPINDVSLLSDEFSRYIWSKAGILADSTLKGYAHIRDQHFQRIMNMPVPDITQEDIQASFDDEITRGWSKKTLKNYKSVILKVLAECRPDFYPEIRLEKE